MTLSGSPQRLHQPAGCYDVGVEELGIDAAIAETTVDAMTEVSDCAESATDSPRHSEILQGVRILDLSNVLAGPVSGRTLAEYGADVIKIDPPDPNFGPRISCMFPIEASPGKRSMLLDVTSRRGREVFFDLLKTTDVVVHNFRPGVDEKMGIDYDTLKRIKSDLIYLNISAFNGPQPGPWRNRSGVDPVLQAATGIQLRYGGEGEPPRYHGWASCINYMTGFSGAFGVALSLLRNKRDEAGSCGDMVRTSMAQGAQLVQATLLWGTTQQQPGGEAHGQGAVGDHALYRMYLCSDGWVFIAALTTERILLAGIDAFTGLHAEVLDSDERLQDFMEQTLGAKPVDYWIEIFNRAGVVAHRVDSLKDVCTRNIHEGSTQYLQSTWRDERTISWARFTDHCAGGAVELSAPAYVRLRNSTIRLLSPTPKQGADTCEVLVELGYSEKDIDVLLTDGVIKEQLHERYLPG